MRDPDHVHADTADGRDAHSVPTRDRLGEASDAILVLRSRAGDADAFAVLASRHVRRMRAYATRMLGSRVDADDAVQDALLRAWRTLDSLKAPERFAAWLARLTASVSIDRIRARKPDVALDDDLAAVLPSSEGQSPERTAELHGALDALAVALATLPYPQREVWLLREYEGASYAEIGETLGISESTVRGMLARARKSLAEQMEGWR